MKKNFLIVISSVLWYLVGVLAASDENEYRLVRDLMARYDKRIRPIRNASIPLNVTFGLALAQIIDVDEKNQILTTNCWLNQAWIDDNLKWDPSKYGNIKVIRLPYSDIWRPDILLYNNADVESYHSSVSTNVIVTHDGNVTWLSMVIFKSSCSISVRYFPFDQQNCSMVFASWTYDGYQINLKVTSSNGDESNYIPNSEWTLIKLDVKSVTVIFSCCAEPYPMIYYYILIRRLPLYYVFNMVIPCLLITFVALLGFYIPSDSGEKINMGITTLLSMTVFMMLVAEDLPPTSDNLPLLSLYYGLTIGVVSFATGFSVFTLNIHYKGNRGSDVPAYLKNIFLGFFARILCINIKTPATVIQRHMYSSQKDYSATGSIRQKPYVKFKIANNDSESVQIISQNHVMERRDYKQETVFGVDSNTVDTDGNFLSENGPPQSQRFPSSLINSFKSPSAKDDVFERQFSRVISKIHDSIEQNEIRLLEEERRDNIKNNWQQLALVVDRILLLTFVAGVITLTLSIMLQKPKGFN